MPPKASRKRKKSDEDEEEEKEAESLTAGVQKPKTGEDLPTRNKEGDIIFADYPEFRPNLTPREIFELGSFGGTYWRPIYSSVTGKHYKDKHKEYPTAWWTGIPESWLTKPWGKYDKKINQYGVQVGTTLEFWEEKDWISEQNPYGWAHWYCDFYSGKRGPDDKRQVDRWTRTGGPNSRFRRMLINLIHNKNTSYDDFNISPRTRQTLQHWGYRLTQKGCR